MGAMPLASKGTPYIAPAGFHSPPIRDLVFSEGFVPSSLRFPGDSRILRLCGFWGDAGSRLPLKIGCLMTSSDASSESLAAVEATVEKRPLRPWGALPAPAAAALPAPFSF
jgi:hypothetical protein